VEQHGDTKDWLRRLAIQAGIYVGVFLGGALVAFLYSYIPLHGAKNWKIGYLEERLAAKDAEIETLNGRMRALEGNLSEVPDQETFEVLQEELVTADKTVKSLEQQVSRLEKRAKQAERSRDQWKARHAEAEEEARLAAQAEPAAPPAAPAAVDAASPGRDTALVTGATVEVGKRWRSPDGSSDFDLVAITNDRARVVPDASQLRPGVVPTTRDVAAGERFEVDGPDDAERFVHVRRIDGTRRIVIDVTE